MPNADLRRDAGLTLRFDSLVQQTSQIDWFAWVTSVGTLVIAISAVVAIVGDGRRTRRELGRHALSRLEDRWDGPSLRRARAETARHLLSHWDDREHLPDSALELLNIFERVAYLVTSRGLSLDDVWLTFSGEILQWSHVCRLGIDRFQREDLTIYEGVSGLGETLMGEEMRRRGLPRHLLTPSDEDLRTFLRKVLEEARWSAAENGEPPADKPDESGETC